MLVRELLFRLGFDSVAAERNAKRADKVINKVKKSFSRLAAAATAAGIAAVFGATKTLDEYTALESRIKLVTKGMEGLQHAQDGIYERAQLTGTAYEAVSDLFIRLKRSTKNFNFSQDDVLRVTESIQKGLVISGDASSPGAKAALFQLGQGLQSGQELNSVLEQAPRLAEAIADGMGIQIGDLRKTAEQGKVTAEAVMKAILSQSQVIDNEFGKIANRHSQSRQRLINSYKKVTFQLTRQEGVMDSMVDLYDSLREIVESEDFKKSFRFFIQILAGLLKLFVVFIRLLNKTISLLMDAIESVGGLNKVLRIMGSLLLALAARSMIGFAASAVTMIARVGFLTSALAGLKLVLSGLAALIAFISWPVILAAAAFGILFLVIEDLWAFFSGNESVAGKLIALWQNWSLSFTDIWEGIIESIKGYAQKFMDFLQPVINAWNGFKNGVRGFKNSEYNPANWLTGTSPADAGGVLAAANAISQSNAIKNEINISVPPGTMQEQVDYMQRQIGGALQDFNDRQIRQAINNFPEVE